jgi:hypothetical protein
MLLCGRPGLADEIVTDANIVTALDISDSIDLDAMRLEIEGMARAIRSPEVLAAIQSGRYGRIGFAVFAWHHNQFPEVVAWTLIASEEDALAVSRTIDARLRVDVEREARNATAFYIGRLTNLSQAIDHATTLLGAAPFPTGRSIVNVIGNGRDNVGEDARLARDRLVGSGAIVNGLVIGDDPSMLDYYREQVIGGPGAFVMSAGDASALAEAMRNKFIYDIALAHAFIGPPTLPSPSRGEGRPR